MSYGKDLFKGTASYYSRYRPLYSASLVRQLVKRFSLDGKGKMLDLGCGTGQLAYRFSDWFETIIGVDSEHEMIEEAERLRKENRIENINWFVGDLDDYHAKFKNTFKLVTIAKAFHWMERERVLEILYNMVERGGGVAIIDNYSPNKESMVWQNKLNEVIKRWYGNERRAGNTTYSHPKASHQEIIEKSRFALESHTLPPYEHVWTVETILGNLYSTSYGTKRFLGQNVNEFENDLRDELLKVNPKGVFKEEITISVRLAIKK